MRTRQTTRCQTNSFLNQVHQAKQKAKPPIHEILKDCNKAAMLYASVGLLKINIVINIKSIYHDKTSHKISSLLTFVRKIKIKTNLKVTGFNYQAPLIVDNKSP